MTKSVSLIISMSKKASRPGMGNHLLTARLTHREPRLSFANHGLRVPTSTNADNGALREMQRSRLRALFCIVQCRAVAQGTHDLSSTTYDSPFRHNVPIHEYWFLPCYPLDEDHDSKIPKQARERPCAAPPRQSTSPRRGRRK